MELVFHQRVGVGCVVLVFKHLHRVRAVSQTEARDDHGHEEENGDEEAVKVYNVPDTLRKRVRGEDAKAEVQRHEDDFEYAYFPDDGHGAEEPDYDGIRVVDFGVCEVEAAVDDPE